LSQLGLFTIRYIEENICSQQPKRCLVKNQNDDIVDEFDDNDVVVDVNCYHEHAHDNDSHQADALQDDDPGTQPTWSRLADTRWSE